MSVGKSSYQMQLLGTIFNEGMGCQDLVLVYIGFVCQVLEYDDCERFKVDWKDSEKGM